ncbi:potassium-transporting ATPase subunit KdpC [Tumebacillus permanentifrigoris]|uniref:Potassium-transporting ATPase KdpC subunit n=1 Tax=Tumebacillus permanentifrigoris TaxID=378543 RepID=A0A316DFU9_9BACL|nr:potassium-transporting ATPase subunit KdpC [Tumebacillus permanentifrigoris]PWK15044.1 K+-transporting ATPase ATPase C chain [Tumebacillus permanentifrigoris]
MKTFITSLRLSLAFMLLCGLAYPFAVTGVAQAVLPDQANGSIISNQGKEVGSKLIGQDFHDPKYFQGRVSSIKSDAAGSGTPNYAPSNEDMKKRVEESISTWKQTNPDVPLNQVPVDLITNSGSGLDPHISPEAAFAQIPRIAKAIGLSSDRLHQLVEKNTQGPELGLFGEKRVNVLELNLDLNRELQR